VKTKALMLFMFFACAPISYSFGQVICAGSQKLVCQFPASAQTLAFYTYGPNSPQGAAISSAAQSASLPINASIATQLTQLPIPSATVGVVSLRGKGSDAPPVPFDNLGPVLTDRPDTVGKGHLFMGFSYQHFNFNALDGTSLANLPVSFASTPLSASPTTYYGSETNNVSFQLNQYVVLFTLGISKGTDFSFVLPFNSVNIGVTTSNFQAFTYTYASGIYQNLSPPSTTSATSSGSASGLGDVILSLKQLLIGGEGNRPAIAVGGTFRIPSGDEFNYLGSGAMGGSLYGLFEYRARLAPHLKLGYQWNDVSKVVNAGGGGVRLPGGLQYAAGADLKIVRPLTLAVDLLGNQFINTPSLTVSTVALNPIPPIGTLPSTQFPSVTTPNSTYTTVNFSTGLKWTPIPHLLLYGNVLLQANNVGLRSDPVPSFGIAYNLNAAKSK